MYLITCKRCHRTITRGRLCTTCREHRNALLAWAALLLLDLLLLALVIGALRYP